jgi:single-strand DNA-binding protein
MNSITIHGRLTKDPEMWQSQSGVSKCSFSVAVDRTHKNGEEKQTDFFNCVAWRGLGELIGKNFHKGKEILLRGEMQSRKYEKDGVSHIAWELVASEMDFCGAKTEAPTPTAGDYSTIEEDDGKLPF